jgi:phage terminase large subunit-like protein
VPIEDKASGAQLIQALVREGLYAVTRHKPQTDKVMHMHAKIAALGIFFGAKCHSAFKAKPRSR